MKEEPAFWSLALEDIPAPDYADVSIAVLPTGASTDPRVWAMSIFSLHTMPWLVRVALGLRQLLAPLIGVRRADHDVFAVRRVEGDEALLGIDDVHLDFRCGIGVDAAGGLVRVVTTVRLKGRRGRIYFWPVRLAHPVVVRSMLRRAVKRSV